MNDDLNGGNRGAFDEALRRLAARAPTISAGEAARAVLAHLPDSRRGSGFRHIAAVAALFAFVVFGAWLGTRHTTSRLNPSAEELATSPLTSDVMVFWIDPDTQVYFLLSPVGSETGETR
jgi:ferric-dicitrate binding protein FerR (iron transport regulator)